MAFLMGTQVQGPRLKKESFIRKRDFYKERLEEGTSIKGRKSYFAKRLVTRRKSYVEKRLL